MAERFRIDLGFPALYASLSMDTSGITDGVVVYDKEKQQLFYTGSYGAGGGGVAGVSSLEGLTGDIDLIAGSNITITTGSGTITIASTGGGSGITNIITGDGLTGSLSGTTFRIDVDYYGTDNIILEAPNFTPGNESRTNDKLLIYNNDALEVQDITIQQFIDGYNIAAGSNYWFLSSNNNITNSGSLNVVISSSLTLVQTSSNDDILTINRGSETKLKVNNEGVLTLSPNSFFPTAVTGGIIYKDNEYYFGFQ